MRFRVGGTFAACNGCGREDFFPALALTAGRRDVFICAHCGNEAEYSELVRRTREGRQSRDHDPAV
jgi:RNase P subunit RPR2